MRFKDMINQDEFYCYFNTLATTTKENLYFDIN